MTKLLAALGIAGALLLGATSDASAHGWRGPHHHGRIHRPGPVVVVRPAPVYRAPVRRPARVVVVAPAPVYRRPAPVVVVRPAPVVVHPAPVVVAPPASHGRF